MTEAFGAAVPPSPSEGRREWRNNWTVLLAAMFGAGAATFHLQSLGPMIKPLQHEFGWTRTQISGALLIVSVLSLIMNPLVGIVMDRWGARRVALIGIWFFGAALALLGATGPKIMTFYAAYALLALASTSVTSFIWSKAIVDRFDRTRGFALGVMRASLGVFGGAVPILMVWATESFGWRSAYFLLGSVAVLLAFPVGWFFFYDGPDPKLPQHAVGTAPEAKAGESLRDAVSGFRLWQLVGGMVLAALTTGFFSAHLQPLLTDGGIDAKTAALLTGMIGPCAAVTGMLYGALADHFHAPRVTGLFFLVPMLGSLLVLTAGPVISPLRAGIIVVTIGTALGSEGDSIALLTGRFFGARHFGTLSGIVMSSFVLGFGIGPLIGGAVFDSSGSYHAMMYVCIPALAVSALLIATLGRYPTFTGDPSPQVKAGL